MSRPKIRVVVTGANGYLASLIRLYNASEFEFVNVTRADVDLADVEAVTRFFRALEFDACLHLGADASTAHCENDPEMTHSINAESAIAIARVCRARGARMVFFSTEQCFNASPGDAPFCEDDEMVSTTRYGQQKMEADCWIRENLDNYLVLRLSWMFGLPMPGVHPAPNILTNVLRAVRTGEPMAFRVHERRNMTYAQEFAQALPCILALPSGVYHVASQNGLSTYETARMVAHKLGCTEQRVDELIMPDCETYADSPRDFRLSSEKLEQAGICLGAFEENLESCLKDFGLM